METPSFFSNDKVLAARASKLEKARLDEAYQKLFTREVGSFKDFVMELTEIAEHFLKENDQKESLEAKVQQLQAENNNLTTKLQEAEAEKQQPSEEAEQMRSEMESKQSEIADLKQRLEEAEEKAQENSEKTRKDSEMADDLIEENEELQAQIEKLRSQLDEVNKETPDESKYLAVHPGFNHVLEDIRTKESKRTGRNVTVYDLVWRTFHEILKNGPADRFFGVSYSNTELQRLIKKSQKNE